MKYIKRFDTEDGYDSYYNSNSFILPNLSLIDELIEVGNEVRFNPDLDGPMEPDPEPEEPPYDPSNGYEYVDMGFPSGLKWARCNIGAEKESDYGLYFTWGETVGYTSEQVGNNSGQRYFHWITYKWCNGTQTTLNKYNYDSKYGNIDNISIIMDATNHPKHSLIEKFFFLTTLINVVNDMPNMRANS